MEINKPIAFPSQTSKKSNDRPIIPKQRKQGKVIIFPRPYRLPIEPKWLERDITVVLWDPKPTI